MARPIGQVFFAVLLVSACAQDLAVHVRGGDRPPNPEFLVVDGGVTVERFQVVVRNLRLQSEPSDGGANTAGVNVIGAGPYLVDLAPADLTGGAFTPLITGHGIGAKGYYEVDIDLSPASDADVQAVPELAAVKGKTFVITGRDAQGAPFSFESTLEQVLIRPSVFRMGLNHNNIDVNIAPNRWFTLQDGGALDPSSSDPVVRAQIEANVAASIDGYEDDNMDGEPDPLG